VGIKQSILALIGVFVLILGGNWWFRTKAANAFMNNNTPPKVSMIEAVEKVLDANPGTVAVDVNLEHENQQLAWEVVLNNNLEVYIDVNTKEIIKTEQGWNIAKVHLIDN
jgi:hypothetical protein